MTDVRKAASNAEVESAALVDGRPEQESVSRAPQAPLGDGVVEALRSAREEIEQARASVSGDDGYNYASGEEYGLRRAVIILDKALAEKLATVDAAIARRAPQAQGDGVAEALRKLIADVSKVAPGPWEVDTEKQGDAPDRHNEYVLLDARGYRLLGTENCDHRFGEIMIEYDEYGATAWNEPSRVLLEYIATLSPDKILAALAHKEGAPTADLARAVEAHDHLTKLLDEARHVYAAAEVAGVRVELGQYRRLRHGIDLLATLPFRAALSGAPQAGERITFKNGPVMAQLTYAEFLAWLADRMEHVHGENPNYDYMHRLRELAASVVPAPPVEGWRPIETALLAEMAKHIRWELDWGEKDPIEDGSECGWRIHERSGNRNDREWHLIGYGPTPEAALRSALSLGAAPQAGEDAR